MQGPITMHILYIYIYIYTHIYTCIQACIDIVKKYHVYIIHTQSHYVHVRLDLFTVVIHIYSLCKSSYPKGFIR